MNPNFEKLNQRIIKAVEEHGDVYQEVDGFWVFEQTKPGGWYAYDLRIIADYLDELNEPLQRQINEYFEDKQ